MTQIRCTECRWQGTFLNAFLALGRWLHHWQTEHGGR